MDGSRETIIMVDDDITNLNVARNNLSEQYSFITAPSGEKLFHLLEKITPSLILLDIEMPEMGGYEVIKKLKSNEKTQNIPVIFLTGKVDTESELEGFNLGAVDYILKPFSKELLVKRVDLHIALSREKAINEINERLMLMLDTSPLCTQIWDKNLNTIDCNEAGVKLYGFKNKAEYAQRFINECSPEFQPDGRRSDEKAVKFVHQAFEEGYCRFDWMHQVPDTLEPIPADITLVRVKYKDEDVVVGYTRDLREHKKLTERIENRDKLLEAVNKAATLLLAIKVDENIDNAIMTSLDFIGRAVDVNRIHIWRSSLKNQELKLKRLYGWVSDSKYIIDDFVMYPKVNDWNNTFAKNEHISGPVSMLSEEENEYFSGFGIKSIVLIPLFLDDRLWGMFSLDDCVNEREFSDDEVAILRSVSLMLASSGNKHIIIEKRTRDFALQTSTLETLLDSIPDLIFTKDEKLRFTHCNKALLAHFGKSKKELIGHTDMTGLGLSKEFAETHEDKEHEILRTGNAVTVEEYLPKADGTVPYYETTVLPLTLGYETVGVVGIARDITERKEKEQRMKIMVERSKELSSALAEITKSSTISEGDLKAAANYIAKEACNVLNVSRISIWSLNAVEDTLTNLSCFSKIDNDFVIEEDFSLVDREGYKEMLVSDRLIMTSNIYESAKIEGSYNPDLCAMLEAPVRLDGKTIGLVCADQDKNEEFSKYRAWLIEEQSFVSSLSDLMALAISSSERQAAREEAQNASRAKSEFLANMSHEIRTPMNVIVGLTELLLEGDNPSVNEKEYLQKINTAGNTLVGLINDVLDISKIEAGKFTLLPAQYELAGLLNDVIILSIMRIGDKPITFSLDIETEVYSMLSGDDLRVKQILVNLLSNAFKYTREGTVTLSVKCQRGEVNDVWLTFSVIDTGIGMRPEDLEKLFTNYNQVDTRANRMIEGTGLGLTIAKGFIELMEGQITVDSKYGEGSTFSFSIKQGYVSGEVLDDKIIGDLKSFKYDDTKSKTERQVKRPDLSWANVLVVDDAPTNLDVAKGLLGKYKMNVDCVSSGQDAIDRMELGEPAYDAIFMDHMMPGMDGIEAASLIRKIGNDYVNNIPIIALTANAVAGNERLFLEEGFQAFVSKPINVTKLDAAVRRWIMKDEASSNKKAAEFKEKMADSEGTATDSVGGVATGESTSGGAGVAIETADDIDIPGVNATLGLSLYEDDIDMYISILQSFAENTLIEIDKLRDVNEDSIENYAIDIHTMKGVSATIGAKALSVRAKKMERMAKEGDITSILVLNDEFIKDAEILVDDVVKWLEKNT